MNIKWTRNDPGDWNRYSTRIGVDEAGNRYHQSAGSDRVLCILPDGRKAHGWTPEGALANAQQQPVPQVPDAVGEPQPTKEEAAIQLADVCLKTLDAIDELLGKCEDYADEWVTFQHMVGWPAEFADKRKGLEIVGEAIKTLRDALVGRAIQGAVGGPLYCEHCGDGPTCVVCGRGTKPAMMEVEV